MHISRKALKYKALSERGKKMAEARWKRERERRNAEMPERMAVLEEMTVLNLPRSQGDLLGTLQWTDQASGKVRRWQIRLGDRRDRICFVAASGKLSRSCGWSHFLTKLRKHLCSGG